VKLILVLYLFAQAQTNQPKNIKPPQQPIPYSHKTHLGLGLQCKNCHTNPDPGEMMGIPETKVCMNCHQAVKTDSPHIQKLTEHAKQNRPVPWIRVYEIPGYVYFSHKAHIAAGATCETCHGPVKDREVLWRETNISMGGCMDCHTKNKASNDCGFCHQPR
jgi:Zn ribbon nucleic-acid-binding protein